MVIIVEGKALGILKEYFGGEIVPENLNTLTWWIHEPLFFLAQVCIKIVKDGMKIELVQRRQQKRAVIELWERQSGTYCSLLKIFNFPWHLSSL